MYGFEGPQGVFLCLYLGLQVGFSALLVKWGFLLVNWGFPLVKWGFLLIKLVAQYAWVWGFS